MTVLIIIHVFYNKQDPDAFDVGVEMEELDQIIEERGESITMLVNSMKDLQSLFQ